MFPERPYIIHQNSPLAWSILAYIHYLQNDVPAEKASTNLHQQKNTLYLESLRYGVILHAKRILKTIEDGCMKCLTGLVERRMRMVHDFMGKLNMQGTGMSVSDISLMFQYVACRINTIPYGVKNIHILKEKFKNLDRDQN